ncbi:hypothetical protein CBR56_07735 [Bacillus thuringiensis]|nr:hypothetical protein BK728_10785 [Bacillus thuringiensis serovar chanpaisis]PNK31485.1 hypothetical protein CBR56_07735 [Bacillus thuringiensis]
MKFYNIVITYFDQKEKLETATMSLPLNSTNKETLQCLKVGFVSALAQKGYQLNTCRINGVAF